MPSDCENADKPRTAQANLSPHAGSATAAIDPWRDPYSAHARGLASAIFQSYRKLQEVEAGVSENADWEDIARLRRRLHDEWYCDLVEICHRSLRHLTDTLAVYEKRELERINLTIPPVQLWPQPRPGESVSITWVKRSWWGRLWSRIDRFLGQGE